MMISTSFQKKRDLILSILVILPSVILVGIFVYGFIGNTIYVSLTDWGRGAGLAEHPVKNFIGLSNYKELFTGFIHGRFRQDFVNAIFYTLFLLAGTLSLGLFFAILLDRSIRFEGLFKTVFLYPMALSFIVTGTIWRWLLAPSGGLNILPTLIGLKKIDFLWTSSRESILNFNWQSLPQLLFAGCAVVFLYLLFRSIKNGNRRRTIWNSIFLGFSLLYVFVFHRFLPPILPYEEIHGLNLATLGIMMASIWQYSGYTMALYLAGLRGLPASIREASRIDGASEIIYYWKIAIPNIRPITLSAIIILAHISLKMFDLIFAMAGADNANTGHPSINMYLTTFRANNFAVGAAIAVILFFLAAILVIPYLFHSHRERRGIS
jgi:glucose/mannose transport system permease protein